MSFFSKNNALTIGLIVIVLAGVWYMFFGGSKPADVSVTQNAGSPEELFFINKVSELDPIAFDTAIFSDARFFALIDIKTAILPEPIGRKNPFAPIGKDK